MKKDLEGKTFGSWKVVSYSGYYKKRDWWSCTCVCGKTKDVQQRILLSGESKSCGCIGNKNKIIDISGKKFGKLTVISVAYSKGNRVYWNCKCDCGNDFVAMGRALKTGNTSSCGCINHGKGQIRRNIKGRKFGELTAEEYLGVINNHSFWRCACSCGKKKDVEITALLTGNTTSCGCKHYPESDSKELAELFNKHVSTIIYVKKLLFGEYVYVLSEEQRNKMQEYFADIKKSKGFSKGEKEVLDFVKSIYKGDIIENDRNVVKPKELDIYIPEKNFAIEYDGLYWHSEASGCSSNYHIEKTNKCNELGIRLLNVYENEWRNKKEIVKSMIASALGVYERKIFARNCELREVKDKEEVRKLFDENHLQGTVKKYSKVLGLYYKDELVQACMFGIQHFGKNGDMELYRMVTLKNTQVLGGFSKIMKHCGYRKVVSYVSLRTFNASGYYNSGWNLEHIAAPSFCITDGMNTFSRQEFKKEKCLKRFDNVTPDMTEREMCMKNGFYRLWDCGTYKVVYQLDLQQQ